MKVRALTICMVAIVMLAGSAQAVEYVSTFNVTQADFVLYGFSEAGFPTDGPDYLDVSNIMGTYDLNIPPEGGLWDVLLEGTMDFDFDQDGSTDATCVAGPINLGQYASPGPSTSWGPGEIPLPELTFEYDPFPPLTLHDLLLGFEVDLDGEYPSGNYGPNAYANFIVSNDTDGNLGELNAILTILDNEAGGGDGIIDGWCYGAFTVTAVPEPATLTLLALGGLTLGLARRKA